MQALKITPLWRRLAPILVAIFIHVAVLMPHVWPWLNAVMAGMFILAIVIEFRAWLADRRRALPV